MFNSISEALDLVLRLSKTGAINNKEYRAGIKYLKSKGYVMSAVGLKNDNKAWDYRSLRARIYTLRSLRNENCNICIDEELVKGWKIPSLNKEVLNIIVLRENTDNYLF